MEIFLYSFSLVKVSNKHCQLILKKRKFFYDQLISDEHSLCHRFSDICLITKSF
jgi:hypothetical protein